MTPTPQDVTKAQEMASNCALAVSKLLPTLEVSDTVKLMVSMLNLPSLLAQARECGELRKLNKELGEVILEHSINDKQQLATDKESHADNLQLSGLLNVADVHNERVKAVIALRDSRDQLRAELSRIGELLHATNPDNQHLTVEEAAKSLRAELDEARHPRIFTRCPACNNDTLTINNGRLLCTWVDCKNPTIIDRIGEPGHIELVLRDVVGRENAELRTREKLFMQCVTALQGFLGDGDIEREISDARKALAALKESGVVLE